MTFSQSNKDEIAGCRQPGGYERVHGEVVGRPGGHGGADPAHVGGGHRQPRQPPLPLQAWRGT